MMSNLSMVEILQAGPEPGEDATVDRIASAAFNQFVEYGFIVPRSTTWQSAPVSHV